MGDERMVQMAEIRGEVQLLISRVTRRRRPEVEQEMKRRGMKYNRSRMICVNVFVYNLRGCFPEDAFHHLISSANVQDEKKKQILPPFLPLLHKVGPFNMQSHFP